MTLDLDHLRRVAETLVAEHSEGVQRPSTITQHIAAFDPPTVLALIDRLEAAEAKVARVEALADRMDARRSNFWVFPTNQMPLRLPSADLRDALSGDLTASEGDSGPEGHRDDDNAGDGRCGAQEGTA